MEVLETLLVTPELSVAKEKAKEVRSVVVDRMLTLMVAAFGLVAALAWNSAVQAWFASKESLASAGPWAYAIIVTFMVVIVTMLISWLGEKLK